MITAQPVISAPRNYVNLIKEIIEYKKITEAAIKSLSGHFWYLCETLIDLALFFYSQVTIVSMVLSSLKEGDKKSPRRIKL